VVCGWDRYEKTGRMERENIKKGTWTSSRAKNVENKNYQELRELYKRLDILTNIQSTRLERIGHVVGMDEGKIFKKKLFERSHNHCYRGKEVSNVKYSVFVFVHINL
jgi:hypothetical protein